MYWYTGGHVGKHGSSKEAFLGYSFAFPSLIFLSKRVFIGQWSCQTVHGNTALRRAAVDLGQGRGRASRGNTGIEEQGALTGRAGRRPAG